MQPAEGVDRAAVPGRALVGRLAAVLLLAWGLVAAVSRLLPGGPETNRPGLLAVAVLAIGAGLGAWFTPWERWPRAAGLWLAPVALALVAAGDAQGGAATPAAGVFVVLVFAWVGFGNPTWTSLKLSPLAALASVLPVLARPGDHGIGLGTAAVVVPVAVLVGESAAWLTGSLRRTAAELGRRTAQLELMRGIASASNEARSVEEALRRALDLVCGHTGWPVGHAFVLDEDGGTGLASSGIWHLADPRRFETFRAVTEATRAVGAAGLPARVLATGRPAWVADLAREPTFLDGTVAAELDIRASFAFPVLIDRQVAAVLEFFASRPAEPDHAMLEIMADVGAQLGRVVERRRATEAVRSEEIARRALHDSLTGLPNMTLFTDHLTRALSRLSRRPGTVGVLFLDLDRFKAVNDTYGHAAGSALLVHVVRRLEQMVRPTDTIARFGGDEFVVLCEDLPGKQEALRIAERITVALAEPFEVDGRRLSISGSVGVAMSQEPGRDPEELIHDADAAMYRAKRHGRNRYELFDARMRSQARGRRRVETALRDALQRGELRLYLQPVVRLEDGAVVGAEALVRWRHPTRGLLAPAQFLLVAEEAGLIVHIDHWMLGHAGAWLKGLQETAGNEGDGDPFWVSLNASARLFEQADLAEMVDLAVRSAGIDPASICLEVSETSLVDDPEAADDRMRALKDVGIRLAVDGFGTGFASTGFVNRFPVDMVKIARPLIGGLGTSGRHAVIVEGIVGMARALGLQTVGEGVETEGQAAALRGMGCQMAQGNHWSRPQPAESLARMLERQERGAGSRRGLQGA